MIRIWPWTRFHVCEQEIIKLKRDVRRLKNQQRDHLARKTAREAVLKYWVPGIAALAVAVMAVGTGTNWFS